MHLAQGGAVDDRGVAADRGYDSAVETDQRQVGSPLGPDGANQTVRSESDDPGAVAGRWSNEKVPADRVHAQIRRHAWQLDRCCEALPIAVVDADALRVLRQHVDAVSARCRDQRVDRGLERHIANDDVERPGADAGEATALEREIEAVAHLRAQHALDLGNGCGVEQFRFRREDLPEHRLLRRAGKHDEGPIRLRERGASRAGRLESPVAGRRVAHHGAVGAHAEDGVAVSRRRARQLQSARRAANVAQSKIDVPGRTGAVDERGEPRLGVEAEHLADRWRGLRRRPHDGVDRRIGVDARQPPLARHAQHEGVRSTAEVG
jgi:hypothetical protein